MRDFPGGSGVKTPSFHCRGKDLISGGGTKIHIMAKIIKKKHKLSKPLMG